ncbi:hypothetical protein J7J83_00355 [bacterium]|nr:hypothetical protein [bacterium]
MKKFFIAIFFITAITSFSACDNDSQVHQSADKAQTTEKVQTKRIKSWINSGYIGSWSRVSATLDGVVQNVDPATIKMTENTYESSTAKCTIKGNMSVRDGIMSISITDNDCPGGIKDRYISTFQLSDDGKQLTLINTQFGGKMVEIYDKLN